MEKKFNLMQSSANVTVKFKVCEMPVLWTDSVMPMALADRAFSFHSSQNQPSTHKGWGQGRTGMEWVYLITPNQPPLQT